MCPCLVLNWSERGCSPGVENCVPLPRTEQKWNRLCWAQHWRIMCSCTTLNSIERGCAITKERRIMCPCPVLRSSERGCVVAQEWRIMCPCPAQRSVDRGYDVAKGRKIMCPCLALRRSERGCSPRVENLRHAGVYGQINDLFWPCHSNGSGIQNLDNLMLYQIVGYL